MIDTTTPVTPSPTTPLRDLGLRDSSAEPSANDLDKDTFLQLLVAQLRYQDPLDPSDPAEFMATTAQFTVVEKLDELTQQGANTAIISGLSMASSLVGRTVTYVGADDVTATGIVSSAQVSNGEVRLVTDKGIVDLSTVIGIGATDGQGTLPGGPQPPAPAAPSANPAPVVEANEDTEPIDSPAPATNSAVTDPPVTDPPEGNIPVLATLPASPLSIPPALFPTRPEQPTTPATPPLSNTASASDTNTTKEFTS